MTPEQQRIAIAEVCGATLYNNPSAVGPRRVWAFYAPCPGEVYARIWIGDDNSALLPDYISDLNAMHEAEKTLDDKQFDSFQLTLSCIVFNHPVAVTYPVGFKIRAFWHATAAQRAEAFLKTLNLWKE